MKKKMITVLSIGLLLVCFTGLSQAASIDFEAVTTGNYSSLNFGDAVLSSNSGGFEIVDRSPWGGNSLLDTDMYGSTLTFLTNVTDVSIFVGDYGEDEDPVYLEAYDSVGNLLASDAFVVPDTMIGGETLSVASLSAISYVTFKSGNPYPGSVYWDDIEYTAASASVPEPATLLLLG
ncbi:MAG: hypothetical protein HKP58_14460, partial [Desulfatitalea sp.]|nr:hypothetical protein [Desulfatitalea sp.]NNK01608.1 hypothetical protein [Desulfatitalea sp.]